MLQIASGSDELRTRWRQEAVEREQRRHANVRAGRAALDPDTLSAMHKFIQEVRQEMRAVGFSKPEAERTIVNRVGVALSYFAEEMPAKDCAAYFAQFKKPRA